MQPEQKTILVTGATGMMGRKIVPYLLSKGYKVRALVNESNARFEDHPNLEIVTGNIKNLNSLMEASAGVSVVVHLAGAKNDEADSFETNVLGAENLFESCTRNKVGFIVNMSTLSTKIARKGIYAASKIAADAVFERGGVPFLTLKPSIVYSDLAGGVFGSLARFSNWPITPVFGRGKCRFRPIHIDDVARSIETAISSSKLRDMTCDIVGPDLISLDDLVLLISKGIYDKKARILHIPENLGYLFATIASIFFHYPPITKSNILGSTQEVEMDYGSFVRNFGFEPRQLSVGIRDISMNRDPGESKLLLSYLSSKSLARVEVTDKQKELLDLALSENNLKNSFSRAVYRHRFLLGPLDFLSLFYENGTLARKLHIASAILECCPSSADWLLPRRRSIFHIMLDSLRLVFSFFAKVFWAGFLMIFFPNFVKRNVA